MPVLTDEISMLADANPLELRGAVQDLRGLTLRVTDLPAPAGSQVRVEPKRAGAEAVYGEVVGFDGDEAVVMPLGGMTGIGPGDPVVALQPARTVRVGESLLGRVVDGLGRPIDGKGALTDTVVQSVDALPVSAMHRPPVDEPLATGVRAIDTLMPVGKGQRLGVFAAPGVGKSTLLGTVARHTEADVSVIALIGERGREVRDFIEKVLGPEGLARSVVVVATSDEPALIRIRAAMVAAAIAEYFRDGGLDVLLLMDSVTRFCQAQRQVGLAAGEPPTTRGYPPSVFSMLPGLLERSGRTQTGSITGFYAVLVEGDDMNEPVSDACRGVLDGHVLLSRKLAERGHYPAIDVLGSVSRCASDLMDAEHDTARRDVLRVLSAYDEVEDLLNLGAYAPGSNPDADLAIAVKPALEQLLRQGSGEVSGRADFERSKAQLIAVLHAMGDARKRLSQLHQAAARRG